MMNSEFIFDDRINLYQAVTDRCAEQLVRATRDGKGASFIVPGGTTPKPIFERLSQRALDWKNISIAPSDERWINSDHPQSNQWLIEHNLLLNNAAEATFIPLKNDAVSPVEGEQETEQRLENLVTPVSVTLLGMGTDGHFASIFPGSEQLKEALDLSHKKKCIAINAEGCEVAGDFKYRMSLTLSSLTNSQLVILLITGDKKLEVIREAIQQTSTDTSFAEARYPVAALLAQTITPVEIYWAL